MIRLLWCAVLVLAVWANPAAAQSDAGSTTLPPDFHGRVLYFGNHSGQIASIKTNHGGPRSDCIRPDGSCPEQVGGSLQVELTFEGDVVRGAFRGTGGLRESTLIGRRIGPRCDLYDPIDGSMWSGVCDSKNFIGKVSSVPNALVKITLDYRTVSVALKDFSEWDRWAAAQRERIRRYDYLRSVVGGYFSPGEKLHAAVELASYGWDVDPLKPETLSQAVYGYDDRGKYYYYEVTYELDSGIRGWARARLPKKKSDEVACYIFWDHPRPEDCRAFVPPPRPSEPPAGPPPEASSGSVLPPLGDRPSGLASALPSGS